MKLRLISALSACVAVQAFAANVGVVDSGTWFDHDWFQNGVWENADEVAGNLVDDDRNGKVDDVHGWNFAENLSKFFFPEHTARVDAKIYKVFEVLSRIELGTLTPEDKVWWTENVAGLPEPEKKKLIDQLNWYGQYAHGTHTAGIVAHGNLNAKVMSARIFPDSRPPGSSFFTPYFDPVLTNEADKSFVHDFLAGQANKTFEDVARYLNGSGMDVANYSIGVPITNVAKQYLATIGQRNPTPERLKEEAMNFYSAFEKLGLKWMASAPNTLFVVAAGNDGANNDDAPIFPANVSAENAITVAASHDFDALAKFSNYSATRVHVAAPGVAVMSSVPAGERNVLLPMSGTSMAAPYVTMVASRVKDANPALRPADIRRILMETVDKKPWLEGKVLTAGVVNMNRAIAAAELSVSAGVDAAIAQANIAVDAMVSTISSADKANGVPPTAEMRAWARALRF